MLPIVEYIGITAGMLTTFSFLPQVIKIWKTRDASSISLLMYSIFCTGVVLWLAYGIAISSFSIITANIITLLLSGGVLFLKITMRDK
jgi:MtN3 and saliva related transmembrane protein